MSHLRRLTALFLAMGCLRATSAPLSYPLLDAPFNIESGKFSWPSMQQSLSITKDFYEAGHTLILSAVEQPDGWGASIALLAFDIFTTWLPPGNGWLHEEWHRAVLSRHHYPSFNDFYNLPIFSEAISVSHVQDADLVELKRRHPADHVRLQSAGWESEWQLNRQIEREEFFSPKHHRMGSLIWYNNLQSSFYLFHCASSAADASTDRFNADDGASIEKRDFTGLDCTGWVYDLFRPDEPYEARGVHPSGVGLNRYRKFSHLTGEEQDFLKTTAALSLVNFIDPFLFGITPFESGNTRWTLKAQMIPNAFGYSLGESAFIKADSLSLIFTLYQHISPRQFFPGAGAELDRYPLRVLSEGDTLTAEAQLWLQPKDLRFDSRVSKPGGLLSATLTHPIADRWEIFLGVEAKTEGWAAGNVYLDSNLSVRTGVNAWLF